MICRSASKDGLPATALPGRNRNRILTTRHEPLNLGDGQIAVQKISAVVVDGVELENEAEGLGERGLHGIAGVGGSGVRSRRGSSRRRFLRDRMGNVTRMGFRVDAFVKHDRLGIELFLQRLIILRLTDVHGAREPDDRPASMRGNEFTQRDLQLHGVAVRIGDARVGRNRWRVWCGRGRGGAFGNVTRITTGQHHGGEKCEQKIPASTQGNGNPQGAASLLRTRGAI